MPKGSRERKRASSRGFVLGVLASIVLVLIIAVMLLIFTKDPTLAPPGVFRYVALAVPLALLITLVVTLIQYAREHGGKH